MGLSSISGGYQPLQASLQPAKPAQAQALQAGIVMKGNDGNDGDADDGGGSNRLLDIKA